MRFELPTWRCRFGLVGKRWVDLTNPRSTGEAGRLVELGLKVKSACVCPEVERSDQASPTKHGEVFMESMRVSELLAALDEFRGN